MRVLLIEDNPVEQHLTQARLVKAGWPKVTVCQTVAEARPLASAHDVAILDLGLADTSGFGSVEAFRAAIPKLPLIVLTADDRDEQVTGAIRRGADEYLVKHQLEIASLRRAVLCAVERHRPTHDPGLEPLMGRLKAHANAVVLLFQHPHELVLERCVAQGIDATNIHFVDLTQRSDDGLVSPPGISFIGSPVQLEKASIRTFQACRALDSPHVFIDSVPTLTLYNGDRATREFLDGLNRGLELAGRTLDVLT